MKTESIEDVSRFIADYSAYLMGCGVHTSRVIRNSKRIGEAYGYAVNISAFQKSIILTVNGNSSRHNEVVEIKESSVSFEHNSELSALSWQIFDEHIPLSEACEKYKRIVQAPTIKPQIKIILTSLANASFCRLFGGDFLSMAIVLISTVIGAFLKQQLAEKGVNQYINFIFSAFVASLCTSTAVIFDTTSDTALATSVLFLIPGVPLINGVIDIMEGHILSGFARLVKASLLILCAAIGLSLTLILIKNSLL